ncbi:MAG: hypothetical protein DRP71_12490 [Verrucomicrobia bacterium]|nr:MAG: hypothetical protein DRP71_12490 [Verrucomicrobiota bacterium]
MNPRSKHQQWKGRAVILLAGSLLALPAGLSAQDDLASELARLRAENARLREQIAVTEAPPAQEAARPAERATSEMQAETTATRTTQAGEEIVVLSPFEVNSEKDFGYLRTNAATASRIGMDIQNTPMSIAVMSEDFIKDTGMRTVTDVFRYTASGSPDGRFEGQRPANEATPRGNFTMRGFKVNALLRNGVFRYTSYNLDNIERVEIVKGPAAVFFGQGYPGGVVNYITKKPVFGEIPTTVSYYFGNNGSQGAELDHNSQLSEKAAFRIVGAWHDDKGPRDGQYLNNWNVTPSLAFIPFEDGQMKIDLSLEVLEQKYNSTSHSTWGWIYPDEWFRDYSTPPDDQMQQVLGEGYDPDDMAANQTAYRAKIHHSVRTWHNAKEAIDDVGQQPLYGANDVKPGARYYDANGTLIYDRDYHYAAGGSFSANSVVTFQGAIEWSPLSWLDARYVFTQDRDRYDAVEGRTLQQADFTFNQTNGGGTTGYYRDTQNHQLDLIFKLDFWGTKTKLLLGAVDNKYFQQYNANFQNTPIYWQVPGYNYPEVGAQEDSWGARIRPGYDTGWNVPVNQVLYDRNGNVRTPADIYTRYDPGVDVRPDNAKVYPIDRNLLDGYKPELTAYYVNLQTQMFEDRLTLMLGYRQEESKGTGQWLQVNAPWFDFNEVGTPAGVNQEEYPPDVWNYSPSYSVTNLGPTAEREGDSYNIGLSWRLNDENNIFVTYSKTFKLNFGYAGGFLGLRPDAPKVVEDALEYASYKGENGYDYLGTRITSLQQGLEVMDARGTWDNIPNEEGFNTEIGWKTSMNDNKLVGTISVFQGVRRNEKLDDSFRQSNDQEPYNRTVDLFSEGPTELEPDAPARSAYYNTRVFRWRTVGVENTVTGTELEFIWTPITNYQAVINGAYLWQAETTDHPRYELGDGGIGDIYLSQRIENVPEITFNIFNKYTFTETFARGLSLGLGMRYRSETIVSRSIDWNADNGGFTAGNYLVFDANISYPWSVGGFNFVNTLQVTNLTDETYYEGSFYAANKRTWRFYTTLEF